jgi:hypothetical protein
MEFPYSRTNADEIHQPMMHKKNNPLKQNIRPAPFVVIFIFLVLGIIGITLEEPSRVLEQATQICLPCIGIG